MQDNIHYLVMEHIDGETLQQRVERGPLPLARALEYSVQIVDALDRAHRRGVTHRDLKPGNVMLPKSGVKLLDFGLATRQTPAAAVAFDDLAHDGSKGLTAEGAIMGTLQYISPEQLEGKPADGRADIFAFGTLAYEMITGRAALKKVRVSSGLTQAVATNVQTKDGAAWNADDVIVFTKGTRRTLTCIRPRRSSFHGDDFRPTTKRTSASGQAPPSRERLS
jgi:serine/threonine protein kinase